MKKIVILLLVILCIPITTIYANDMVYIGGDSIGVEGYYEGLYVNGTFNFKIKEETIDPSKYINNKDIIVEVNNHKMTNLVSFQETIQEFKQIKNEIPVIVLRDGKKRSTTLVTTMNKDGVQCGLYLKEKILGIGTLTFYNPNTLMYGALGHSISEEGNEDLQTGNIYESTITSIDKSTNHEAGEKIGNIDYTNQIGDIDKNVDYGIFGNYFNEVVQKEQFEIANNDQVALGQAFFYTVIDQQKIEKFEIEITKINLDNAQKAIEFKIVDKNLIDRTGGIVHGMSGSPIVQNNKIIGAITHVVVEEPTLGYAIFINTMIEASK